MYPGWVILGDDPLSSSEYREIFNNARAYAYAQNFGITWLDQCTDCEAAANVIPDGSDVYTTPINDQAPWYDQDNPDTWGFLGVIGLEVVGDETSTRRATVQSTIQAGGVIGPVYYGPRTLVFRGIAIAQDECSLQAGLDWMRYAQGNDLDPCRGDILTFFDCCPCVCDDGSGGGPCWADNYLELREGPDDCPVDTWWPTTYEELREGPPLVEDPEDNEWCAWVANYRQLRLGVPSWGCCFDDCIRPYMRTYRNVRITEGPNVLRHPAMYSCGAMVEFEITVVAADPVEYAMPNRTLTFETDDYPPEVIVDPDPPEPPVNPYAPTAGSGATLVLSRVPVLAGPVATTWDRVSVDFPTVEGEVLLQRLSPIVRINNASGADSGEVRVGIWSTDGELLAGWYLPFVVNSTFVEINVVEQRTTTLVDGVTFPVRTVRSWFGGPPRYQSIDNEEYVVTVDQPPADAVNLEVVVTGTPTGSA